MKDTTDFSRKLNGIKSVQDKAYLVSLDIKSLYTSIPNAEGIKIVKESFDKYNSKNKVTKVRTIFLTFSLSLSYLQIKRCDIGTICVPS